MAQQSRKPIVDPREAERRRSLFIKVGAAVVLIAIAIGIGTWVVLSHKSSTGDATAPSVATGNAYRITTAPKDSKPVTLTLVEDFQCPACRAFEQQFGSVVDELRNNPKVAVEYQPIAFLDRMSSTNYSSRSANASACVAESTAKNGDWSAWIKFHDLLYANQPEEGGSGLTDDQLNQYANQAGAENVKQCIDDQQFGGFVKNATSAAKITATPTVRINGQDYELTTPDAFRNAVLQAAANPQ